MIIVEPPAARYESSESCGPIDEHLLERISLLESKLSRMTDRLERTLDLLLRHAQNSYFDRSLLKTLIGILSEDGVVDGTQLERQWQRRCELDSAAQEQSARRQGVRAQISASYRGADRPTFEGLINEGFLLIDSGDVDRGIRALQRASRLDAVNRPLLSFVGEHFFRTSRTKLARAYLTRAFELSPKDNHVLLLLGLVCGDEGEAQRAKELLTTAARRGGPSFAAHFGLGRLFLAERNWRQALRQFKRALAAKPSPEAHYALGCLYYELQQDELAARHLLKALELDDDYSEASQLLGLVYRRGGRAERQATTFRTSVGRELVDNRRRRAADTEKPVHAPLTRTLGKSKKLVTGGDLRLARVLREEALKAFLGAGREEQ